jgi:hypothetical protein
VYLTEKRRIAGGRVVEGSEIAEKRHPGWAMLLGKHSYRHRKLVNCFAAQRDLLTLCQVNIRNV